MIRTTKSEPPITHGEVMRHIVLGEIRLTYSAHAPQQSIGPHAHPVAALTIPLHGGFVEVIDGRVLECRPGSVLFKSAGAIHQNLYSSAGAHSLILEIPPTMLQQLALTMKLRNVGAEMMEGLPWARALRLHAAVNDAPDVAQLGAQELICRILGEDLEYVRTPATRTPYWLSRTRERVECALPVAPSLADLAGAVDVHPVYLARAFRQHYGCSIGKWIQRVRIDRAILALTRTDEPIAHIALRLGFYDQPHLTRQFRYVTGSTPAAFRRMATHAR